MARPLDDLGPDFDRRWKQAPKAHRRELVAELRDLYVMLEVKDSAVLTRLRNGSIPPLREGDADVPMLTPEPGSALRQPGLFDEPPQESASRPAPSASQPQREQPTRENPFLPRSVLDRLQQSRDQAGANIRSLLTTTAEDLRNPASASSSFMTAPLTSHEQSDLERELRLKLGPLVETLIEAQMEQIKSELRVRLRLEMDRLIAEHLRK